MHYLITSKHNLIRFLPVIPFSAAVTFLLLLLMKSLVAVDFEVPVEHTPVSQAKSYVELSPPEPTDSNEPEKPKDYKAPPAIATRTFTGDIKTAQKKKLFLGTDAFNYAYSKNIKLHRTIPSSPIEKYITVAKYPSAALRNSIEGWVDIKFDINARGNTENIVVLDAKPKRIFNRSAKDAVRRWQYQPVKDMNGRPKRYSGIKKRLKFSIET